MWDPGCWPGLWESASPDLYFVSNGGRVHKWRLQHWFQGVRPRLALGREKVRDDCLGQMEPLLHHAPRATRPGRLAVLTPESKLASTK